MGLRKVAHGKAAGEGSMETGFAQGEAEEGWRARRWPRFRCVRVPRYIPMAARRAATRKASRRWRV